MNKKNTTDKINVITDKTINKDISIIIVEKNGTLKNVICKDYNEEELFKKCGFKKADDFILQTTWKSKIEGSKYIISLYAKTDGKANTENKYDFPPPVDTQLFFGNIALVCSQKQSCKTYDTISFSIDLWNKIYEKLFGGFENLAVSCLEDEYEIDELDLIPADKKTKQGYLKDGFVIDSDDNEEDLEINDSEDEEEEDGEEENSDELDAGSELSEEEYLSSDESS